MAGTIIAILMFVVLSRRLRVPNAISNEESGPSIDTGQADIEAEGLQLHRSAKSNTGYFGVHRIESSFLVRYKNKHLGLFATAVEGAVAYAKAAGGSAEHHDNGLAPLATEAKGLKLHMSPNSRSGYLGVSKHTNNRFQAQHKGTACGSFATAVEAAVAYAKADTEAHRGQHAQAPRENLSDVLHDSGHDSGHASSSKNADDTDLFSGSEDEDEDENFTIRGFPSKEMARASEQRLLQLRVAAKAAELALAAANTF